VRCFRGRKWFGGVEPNALANALGGFEGGVWGGGLNALANAWMGLGGGFGGFGVVAFLQGACAHGGGSGAGRCGQFGLGVCAAAERGLWRGPGCAYELTDLPRRPPSHRIGGCRGVLGLNAFGAAGTRFGSSGSGGGRGAAFVLVPSRPPQNGWRWRPRSCSRGQTARGQASAEPRPNPGQVLVSSRPNPGQIPIKP
jgi:hypothetical protein